MFKCLSQKITLTSLTTIDLGYLGESKKNKKQKTKNRKRKDKRSKYLAEPTSKH
jgi:hypothetical protein